MNGGANALVGPTTADVGHGGIDLLVGGLRVRRQEGGGGHQLTGLAIAALGDVDLPPGTLERMVTRRRETFDGRDLFPDGSGDRKYARASGDAIDVHRAGT